MSARPVIFTSRFMGNNVNNSLTSKHDVSVEGDCMQVDGDRYYRISNSQLMPEFFMSLVGASDHWMFVSSAGALTAGRRDPDSALFPYAADDQISAMRRSTGCITKILARKTTDDSTADICWEPFTSDSWSPKIQRNLYKTPLGNKLIFEEVHHELNLVFRYRWAFSERFGFVRSCHLENIGGLKYQIKLCDGLRNIVPYGVGSDFLMRFSNLANAYKKSELLPDSGLGIFYLSSIPTDRAEPSEGLRATTIWQFGLRPQAILLSDARLADFSRNGMPTTEVDVRGKVGAYIVCSSFELNPLQSQDWHIVSELSQDQTDVIALDQWLQTTSNPDSEIAADIEAGERALERILASCDGLQCSENPRRTDRHCSNTVFNAMRGGVPWDNYRFPAKDFRQHISGFNRAVMERNRNVLDQLPATMTLNQLQEIERASTDPDLVRLTNEYLPLAFSRRHGDPTRPWNRFSIRLKSPTGETNLNYQGNWRDIFQNWEALAMSFPKLLTQMICRFVNATTADGYNPYRLTKDGFEWEEPEPHDPWSNIGYWGDHQIIYLLKLLEAGRKTEPSSLDSLMNRQIFVHAQVPYRIKTFEQIQDDPHATIEFDQDLSQQIARRVQEIGTDGKFLRNQSDDIHRVSLLEKLLTLTLAKLSNFVPDGGIWLNTQRPEWNDANNALVGHGLSMVTTCYLLRWCEHLSQWLKQLTNESYLISSEVANFLNRVQAVLAKHLVATVGNSASRSVQIQPDERQEIVEALGQAGSDYRQQTYNHGPSGEMVTITREQCLDFFACVCQHLERTIRSNRRDDGLFHSYNLLNRQSDGLHVEFLDEMLEGQVAALSSGLLTTTEVIELLDGLRSSRLYRANQNSYLLYPDRQLPGFLAKNQLPESALAGSPLLTALLRDGRQEIIKRDVRDGLHFNGTLRNAKDLKSALQALPELYQPLVSAELTKLVDLFVDTFGHRRFTGRSGTFFGYEGLGSIYWHMVSKLGLAVCENFFQAIDGGATAEQIEKIRDHYHAIRSGIGAEKSPVDYGAFPSDPYSHTPENAGVKQPGMTGQVKEDVLARFLELGLHIQDGCVHFRLELLDRAELLEHPRDFVLPNSDDGLTKVTVPARGLAFTFCQTPIVYRPGNSDQIVVFSANGQRRSIAGCALDAESSQQLYSRSGEITLIECHFQSLSAMQESNREQSC